MADSDWKKRTGIKINYSSEDEEANKFVQKASSTEDELKNNTYHSDDNLSDFDHFGKTPPRTRILRRTRERKQRDRGNNVYNPKVSPTKLNRRNTVSNVYFNDLLSNAADSEDSDQGVGKRADKRFLKLLRGSERDLKLDISRAKGVVNNAENSDERTESLPVTTPQPIQIETSKRFMSLSSRPVICFDKKNTQDCELPEGCPKNRVDFYKTFSLLIRMGCKERQLQDRNCKRYISQEEEVWQNELKDLIWLELQAWHADRSASEQDQYLCSSRESIPDLLSEIMSYRFQRKMKTTESRTSLQSNDSGVGENTPDCATKGGCDSKSCSGCLSMYCQYCMESQNDALREVETLLSRLEAAEALYPSSKSFALHFPLCKSEEFVGRVKAMCLWYNMTKHHRLKLLILGRLLMFLQNKHYRWPVLTSASTSVSSGIHSDYLDGNSNGSIANPISRSGSIDLTERPCKNSYQVQFDIDETSPSESNNSTGSSAHDRHIEQDYFTECYPLDYYNTEPIASLQHQNIFRTTASPYRKYIEDVLKTKGLSKSLLFLEKLHQSVLRKAQITLRKPVSEDIERKQEMSDEDIELERYGAWSPEAQELGLPSYKSAFLFLSVVPLEVIHEFLRMRLEQKPDKPSPLSIRQLMREMKEGIRIAVLHRQRVLLHFKTALHDSETMLENYQIAVKAFDSSLSEVFKVYLDYLTQWALLSHETFQKSLLEEEWCFVQETSPYIPDGQKLSSYQFCIIVSEMLQGIGEQLLSRIDELVSSLQPCHEDNKTKESMFVVCRELQSVFNEERERTMKTISFSKTLRKDIFCCKNSSTDQELEDCTTARIMDDIKNAVVGLKVSITSAIEKVQNACNVQNMDELDEAERITLVSRCREILHQAYRFGFEFHKEISMFISNDQRNCLARSMVKFAKLWMQFVKERCERGRGLRPRWAYQGLDFLMTVCEPCNTIYLSDDEFEDLKHCMDTCISHVIGAATPTTPDIIISSSSPRAVLEYQRFPRSRGSSPSPRSSLRSPHPRSVPRKTSSEQPPHSELLEVPEKKKELTNGDTVDGNKKKQLESRGNRVRDSVNQLEITLEDRLRLNNLIGFVTEKRSEDRIHVRYKRVTFNWQRGIKIGQGRFGKVYTAVNNESGEMMAMKEIILQHNDHRTIRHVAEELQILEGIQHQHLVRYYGIEVHREEMLIFMEFCTEGTLENLVADTESGLPELLVRKFTNQMLSGVAELHKHGIVHRDIKSANIFLTNDGNCLKIGDFGSAIKIKAHTTMPGELQGFVGTQAYMAPEVFMKTNTEGHGRAADVWSAGCVILEMASGKRPWAEFDSNYQIMFKVGMGEIPEIPDTLSDEGQEIVDLCLQHDPKDRATAEELLSHNFVKVEE